MNFGVCCLSVIPVRADSSDKSEMVSQLLFGETFSIHSVSQGWAKIVIDHDNYEGWIDEKQFISLSREMHSQIFSSPKYLSTDLVHEINQQNAPSINILPGSILYAASTVDFLLGEKNIFIQW